MSVLRYDQLNVHDRKVLLFAVLGISPDNIRRLQNGEVLLKDVLAQRISEVMNNPNDTTQCAIVCQNIRQEGASYETLDPDKYLEHINEMKAGGGRFADDIAIDAARKQIEEDSYRMNANATYMRPFLRYFTRAVDMGICLFLVDLICRLALRFDPMSDLNAAMLCTMFSYAVMFLVEPVFLHLFGTTPGKWLGGVRITSPEGRKLSWQEAGHRSFYLLRYGFGFMIPIYNIIRLARSCADCRHGYVLPWDVGTSISHPDKQAGKQIALVLLGLLLANGLDMVSGTMLEAPRNRGVLTEDEFYENCAYIVRYDSITFDANPKYEVITEDGTVKGVTFTIDYTDGQLPAGSDGNIYPCYNEMFVAFMALAGSTDSFSPVRYMVDSRSISAALSDSFRDFSFEYGGVQVTNEAEYTGYSRNVLSNYLYRLSDGEYSYRQTFTVMLLNN